MTTTERVQAALYWLNAGRRYAATGCMEGMREAARQAGRIVRETEEETARLLVWQAVRDDLAHGIHVNVVLALAADVLPYQLYWLREEEWNVIQGRDGRENPGR